MRGAHGGVLRDPALEDDNDIDLRQYEWNDDRGRGRGGRGRGRGGGRGGQRGRGDFRNGNREDQRQPDVGAQADFPSLPPKSTPNRPASTKVERPPQTRKASDVPSPATGGGTWADQVESSEAAKAK